MTHTKNLLLESPTPLTLADRRLYNYLLHNAFNRLKDSLNFSIALEDLQGVYGTGHPPTARLKDSLKRLMRTLISFEKDNQWIITNLLEKAELDQTKAKLFYSYPSHCQELFTNALTLEKSLIQAHFTLKYSNLLYEILADAHYDKQNVLKVEINELRSQLGIADNKLSNFSDFTRFVLNPALAEINAHASFAVKFETQRKGMKVTDVIFDIQTKKNISRLDDPKQIIPPKRPRFFIDNPEAEKAYAYLLNAETKEREKYFALAQKQALKKKIKIAEDELDRPDLWFSWVQEMLVHK